VTAGEIHDAGQMCISVVRFREQLGALAAGGHPVADALDVASAIREGRSLDPRTVVITFDDGFKDLVTHALPVLDEFGFRATVFAVASAIEGHPELLRNGYAGPYLEAAEARQLAASGRVRFGAHGATHVRLRGLDPQALREETVGAKTRLEDALGVAVELYAYPFGAYDAWDSHAREAVASAGYRAAFTSIVGPLRGSSDVMLLPRSRVSWIEDRAGFDALLSGAYDWYAWWQRVQGPPR
jgi:peptidoglycan/xylan/chitin deacetylase (PgdA/CDA1 family)